MGEFNVNKSDGSLEQTAGMPSEYPASQVMLSDGVTSVEDALDELMALPKIKYFNVTVPAASTNYNYSNDKPSDFSLPLAAFSVQGGGAEIIQVGISTIYFTSATENQSTIRILYVAT